MIHVGDCLEVMRRLDANSFDSIVTDPPYHLTTGKKGGTGPASVNLESPYGRSRIGTGFMGMTWDGGDIAFRPETWAEALRVAKPGAFLAAFGGTRTFHRLACAIEDAGWELRDTLMWVYGSGFPKSHNGEWGGTALKPAWEPIILARKPLAGTVAANFAKFGTGGLNIDGCRIESEKDGTSNARGRDGEESADRRYTEQGGTNFAAKPGIRGGAPEGRWPANLMHDGSEEVIALFPKEAGQAGNVSGNEQSKTGDANCYGEFGRVPFAARGDSGSAARFFYCPKASREDRNDGCDGMAQRQLSHDGRTTPIENAYQRNAAVSGNHHPTVKPTELMRWLCRLVTPGGGLVLDPFCGSGSTGRGAIAEGRRFVGIELNPEYAEVAEARIRAVQPGLGLSFAEAGNG